MVISVMRAALMLGGCTGLMACSQHTSQLGAAETQSQHAKLCIAEGQPAQASLAKSEPALWAITVSSEGGACVHAREWSGAYEVLEAPRHGQITQEPGDGKTLVSYRPERGYVGSDSFALRYPPRNVALPYLVGVVP